MAKPHIHCPVNAWDCPYFDANCICMMYPDSDPFQECDDFTLFWEEGENYICYDDHEDEQELLKLGYRFINGEPILLELGYHIINDEPVMPPDNEADDEEEHCFEPGRYFKSMFELNP